MILQIISAFAAVFMFTLLLEVPKQYIPYAAATGAVGWWVYLLVQDKGYSTMAAAFLSTMVVALLSHILARIEKAPVTVFLVSGILPSVPGAAIYRSVYFLIHNFPLPATNYLLETLQIAGAIAMAIFIVDSLFRLFLAYDMKKGAGKP